MKPLSRLLSRGCLTLAAGVLGNQLLMNQAEAQNALFGDHWYEVEMMLVAYKNTTSIDGEHWEQWIDPASTPMHLISQPSRQPDALQQLYRQQQWLDAWLTSLPLGYQAPESHALPYGVLSERMLEREASRIDPQGDMSVIWHQRWIEAVQPEAGEIRHPVSISLPGEPEIKVEGTFSLYLSRYLHITTDLYVQHLSEQMPEEPVLQQIESANGDVIALSSENSLIANAAGELPMQNTTTQALGINAATIPQPSAIPAQQPSELELSLLANQPTLQQALKIDGRYPVRAAHVKLARRMRSNELHYLDHPMLGVVIQLTPIDVPEVEMPEPATESLSTSATSTTANTTANTATAKQTN